MLAGEAANCRECHLKVAVHWRKNPHAHTSARLRRNDRRLLVACGLPVIGMVVNRWNVTLSGLVAPPQWSLGTQGGTIVAAYIPSLVEIAVSRGIRGYALLAFTLGARYLPLIPKEEEVEHAAGLTPETEFSHGNSCSGKLLQ